jgi:hypothetical protein
MADASTMFLTMKRLMALSLGTITPEASQRTRRTCTPAANSVTLLLAPPGWCKLLTALIANSPSPCHACCVLLRGKTNIKVRGRLHQRLARLLHLAQQTVYLSKGTHRSCKANKHKGQHHAWQAAGKVEMASTES